MGVAVGFKAKWSAIILVMILSIFNILVNNFWTLHPHHPHKDFAKYDFFQILSIVGGQLRREEEGLLDSTCCAESWKESLSLFQYLLRHRGRSFGACKDLSDVWMNMLQM